MESYLAVACKSIIGYHWHITVYFHGSFSGRTCDHTSCAQVEINDSLKASCAAVGLARANMAISGPCGLDVHRFSTFNSCRILHDIAQILNEEALRSTSQHRYDAWVRVGSLSSLLHLSGRLMSLVRR